MENKLTENLNKKIIQFLSHTFPACFTETINVKPLKIGIFHDLTQSIDEKTRFFSHTQLRTALRYYTSNIRYLQSINPKCQRIDLTGSPCGEVDEEHVAYAKLQLQKVKLKFKKRVNTSTKPAQAELSQNLDQKKTGDKNSKPVFIKHKKSNINGEQQDKIVIKNAVAQQSELSVHSTSPTNETTTLASNKKSQQPLLSIAKSLPLTFIPGQRVQIQISGRIEMFTIIKEMKNGILGRLDNGFEMVIDVEKIV